MYAGFQSMKDQAETKQEKSKNRTKSEQEQGKNRMRTCCWGVNRRLQNTFLQFSSFCLLAFLSLRFTQRGPTVFTSPPNWIPS